MGAAVVLSMLAVASCSSNPADPPPPAPGPTIDLTGYFLLPSSGFSKSYSNGSTEQYIGPDMVNGFSVVDLFDGSDNSHIYFRQSDRAWVGTLQAAGGGTLFLFDPPLPAPPNQFPETTDHVGTSSLLTTPNPTPVRRITRLIDTGLTVTVGTMTFDSVAMLRQEFWQFRSALGATDTVIDSAYRWYAPGVDEIRQVRWSDGDTQSVSFDFVGGTIDGRTYP